MSKKLCAAVLCALILLSGCAAPSYVAQSAPEYSPAPTPTAAPSPTPTPAPSVEDMEKAVAEAFVAAFTPDFSAYDHRSSGLTDMPSLIERYPIYAELCSKCENEAAACAEAAGLKARALFESVTETVVSLESGLDWRLMAALCATVAEPERQLMQSTGINAEINGKSVHISVELPDFDRLFEQSGYDIYYGALSLFSYLNTAYDENGQLTDNDGSYELSDEYIATILDPLPKRRIKDCWFHDRSKATRRHTGTDIRAREGTDIPSCTEGTVIRVAYNDIAGNYVVVRDKYGFCYVYCHMVELTTFLAEGERVEQGQLIGHVGNTGNSDAPHLHLSIIAPEHIYINPYPVLHRVRYGR